MRSPYVGPEVQAVEHGLAIRRPGVIHAVDEFGLQWTSMLNAECAMLNQCEISNAQGSRNSMCKNSIATSASPMLMCVSDSFGFRTIGTGTRASMNTGLRSHSMSATLCVARTTRC